MSPDHGHAPPHPGPILPMDEAELLHPSDSDARATAGMLIHWLASDPDLVARFARWMEHCPGDLPPNLVLAVLAATHAVLEPGCNWPVPGEPPWGPPTGEPS